MISSHRRPLSLAALLLLVSACADPPATSDSSSSSGTGDSETAASTDTPTGNATDDTGPPALGEARYFLRIDDDPVPPVRLEMDKAKVLEVFGVDAAKKIKLLDVETDKLLQYVLVEIQNACGTQWNQAKWVKDATDKDKDGNKDELVLQPPPASDCAKGNELGKSFGPAWKTSAEFAMVRLLSMTPATADVDGTTLQLMAQAFAENPNLFTSTFQDLLAKSLGIDMNAAFIPLENLTLALQQNLIASHPASTRLDPNDPNSPGDPAGKLPVTLYDAVMDMQPLAAKFSEIEGVHAGILLPDDDTFTTRSDALTAEFLMRAVADSNLRLVEGVDVSSGAGSMFISAAADPLVFDFLDPEKVQMLGIAAMPTVDMRMAITETANFVPACVNTDECMTNLPDAPVGSDYVWSTPLWSLERIVGAAGFSTYGDRTFEECIFKLNGKCPVGVWIGPNKIAFPPPGKPGPAGWTQFSFFDVQVPDSQYFTELLLEIAQVAIHDPTGDNDYDSPQVGKANDIPEGTAKPTFVLRGAPIGLSAEEMIAQIRPNLQAQAGYIANIILGKYWKHNARLDFYYRRATPDAPPVLFFVGKDDPRPDDTGEALLGYAYDKVGFFSDEQLTTKVSSTQIDGVPEADHEKFRLPEGETVLYMQDDEQKTYRLRFFVPKASDPTEIVVHVHAV